MAHKRKDTYVKSPQWWDHLKEYKRVVAKAERKAAKKQIKDEYGEPFMHKILPILKAKDDYERAMNG